MISMVITAPPDKVLYCESAMLNECCDSAFKKRILLKCYDALERVGFYRYRKEGVDWPLHNGFHAWLGLNTGLYRDRLDVNPFVGIHVVQIAKLYNGLDKGRYQTKYSRGVATYAVHMGELAGAEDEPAFAFTPQQSKGFVEAEVDRLANLYATVGLDFARSLASYESLLPLLMDRVPMLGGYPQRVASCLYLMGRKVEARQFVEGFSPRHREYLEGFAVPFLAKLAAEGA
jgi:hypothetical protein